jgi:hypothetical protein
MRTKDFNEWENNKVKNNQYESTTRKRQNQFKWNKMQNKQYGKWQQIMSKISCIATYHAATEEEPVDFSLPETRTA